MNNVKAIEEWVGGIVSPPFFITGEEKEPYRVDMAVWLERNSGCVLAQEVGPQGDSLAILKSSLESALQQPLVGRPRRPTRIRVEEAAWAPLITKTIGSPVEVVVAPTPELDELLEMMTADMASEEAELSYFEQGRVSADVVQLFFESARLIFDVAPWDSIDDGQVLRVDIPALGVEGACLSIIGALGESLGFLVFPSLEGYIAFGDHGDAFVEGSGPIDCGTEWLALSYDRGADLPAALRREVAENAWPVANAQAYPTVLRCDRDGVVCPLCDRDIRIITAIAAAFPAFYFSHPGLFDEESFSAVSESYMDRDDLAVRFTVPYESYELFGPQYREVHDGRPPSEPMPKVGRNDPCPCGSGKKYKKCHLASDQSSFAAQFSGSFN